MKQYQCVDRLLREYENVLDKKRKVKRISILLPSLKKECSFKSIPKENIENVEVNLMRMTPLSHRKGYSLPKDYTQRRPNMYNPDPAHLPRKHEISKILALAFKNRPMFN